MGKISLHHGNCLDVLRNFADNSIDAVITDPPYGLAFMNKKWDYDVPSTAIWKEVLRVLKPGGHLLSFGGTRTYHRMVVNIEDAGFEIRDQIQWLYGSGFPKSLDISKAIDKQAGAEREVVGTKLGLLGYREGDQIASSILKGGADGTLNNGSAKLQITAPATEAAKQWEGWGTALKPANEPIVLARKPLERGLTVSANVLKWGVGGLNIDASRIGVSEADAKAMERCNTPGSGRFKKSENAFIYGGGEGPQPPNSVMDCNKGRFPANLLLDEQAAAVLDEQTAAIGDGASRFFYVAKASKSERNRGDAANTHPTVKPVKLMEYLVKLITPPNGIVLDPFMGSGTTGVACKNLEVEFVGIEREEAYVEIARARIASAVYNF